MTKITVTRKWHNPKISITVDSEQISLSMDMDDFITALIKEIGSVTTVFTQKTFADKVSAAKDRVIEGIKEESLKVI